MSELIKTNLLKADKNQPRTQFDEQEIESLAKSYANFTEQIVDPIEIDENNVIIRGERRWRAAKIAKLPKVPFNRVKVSIKERLERQLLESEPYTAMDKAWGYATAIININQQQKEYSVPEVKKLEKEKLLNLITLGDTKGRGQKSGQSELSRRIGVPQSTISNYIAMLKLQDFTQKAIEKHDVPMAITKVTKVKNKTNQESLESVLVRRKADESEIESSIDKFKSFDFPVNYETVEEAVEKDWGEQELAERIAETQGDDWMNVDDSSAVTFDELEEYKKISSKIRLTSYVSLHTISQLSVEYKHNIIDDIDRTIERLNLIKEGIV